jgi:DNA-binding XRE family transcriptional regulator
LEDLLDRRVTQVELAKWLGYARTSLQAWESGKSVPDPGVQFIYHKLVEDPGFITEIQLWSSQHGSSQQQISEVPASQ